MRKPKDFQLGQKLTLQIEKLVPGGEGLCKIEDFPIFVPNTLPGDQWQVTIISRKPGYARALPEQLMSAGPERQNAPCAFAPNCGGCQWQDYQYAAQLKSKHALLLDNLSRIGGLKPEALNRVQAVKGMAEPWHYRNKGQFPFQMLEGKTRLGFYAPRSHDLTPIDQCLIQAQPINDIMRFCEAQVQAHDLSAYDETQHQGLLRHLIIRQGAEQALVGFVVTQAGHPALKQIARVLQENFPQIVGVVENINPDRGNRILGRESQALVGQNSYLERLEGLEFEVSLEAFFQVNRIQTHVLYQEVLNCLSPLSQRRVLDAYCGTGSISLYLARQALEVVGVEWVEAAVANARVNAKRNDLNNVHFVSGRMEEQIEHCLKQFVFDAAVLDPPRKGCERNVIEALKDVPEIVYVSCNPATLARDSKLLLALGFELQHCQPVDMFPHTHHLESVSLFRKKV